MKKILYALLFCMVFYGCSTDENEELNKGGIAGSVSDQTTGEPVATVNVTLTPGGRSTVTGSDGSFSFTELEPQEYTVNISKEGYTPNTSKITVDAGQPTAAHLLIERIPAKITTDRSVLDYGENSSLNTLSFNIVNTSYEDLDWEITHACAWIKEVKPASGMLKYGKTGTIVVIIDRDLLTSGINEAYVVVTTKNGGGSVEVKLTATGTDRHLAKLNVLDPVDVTATTAKFVGEIMDAGYPEYTERGFVYATSSTPTVDNTLEKITASVTSENQFSCLVKGLTLNQTYYIRAYAINSVGIAYSANQVSFKTQAVLPKVEVNKASNIDILNGTAILHGTISDVGDPAYTERGFVYSPTNSQPTIYDMKVTATGTGKGLYETQVSSLQTNRTYYVRAYAKNEAGIAYSSEVHTFSTEEILPVVQTNAATDEDKEHNSVVLHGTIEDPGTPEYTERGFVYSDVYESPTIYDNKFVVAGNRSGSFEHRVTTLSAKKTYYVRAYATNSKGTNYGATIQIFKKDVVILRSANLMVQPQDLGKVFWDDANRMCENSIYEGYTDWRLPTLEELMVLYNNREKIGGFKSESYWSRTFVSSTSSYYYMSFTDGFSSACPARAYVMNVRAVRTLTADE